MYCFVHLGEVFTLKGNKPTHTHARTHTHTHTHTQRAAATTKMSKKVNSGRVVKIIIISGFYM